MKHKMKIIETVEYELTIEADSQEEAEERAVDTLLDAHGRDKWCTAVTDRTVEEI